MSGKPYYEPPNVRFKDSPTDWSEWFAFCLIVLPVILSGLLTAGWLVWTVVDALT